MVSDTGRTGTRKISDAVTTPSWPRGLVTPSPVAKRTITDPFAMGFVVELTVPSWLRTTAWPVPPELLVKTPGKLGTTGSEKAAVVWPPDFSTTLAVVEPARP